MNRSLFLILFSWVLAVAAFAAGENKVIINARFTGPDPGPDGDPSIATVNNVTVNVNDGWREHIREIEVEYDRPFTITIHTSSTANLRPDAIWGACLPPALYLSGCGVHFKVDGIARPTLQVDANLDRSLVRLTCYAVRVPCSASGSCSNNPAPASSAGATNGGITGLGDGKSVECSSCAGYLPGATTMPVPQTPAFLQIGLGSDELGYSLGSVIFKKDSVSDGQVDREDFEIVSSSIDTVSASEGGQLRQVVSEKFLIDFIDDDGSVVMAVYEASAKGALLPGSASVYAVEGDPIAEYRFGGLPAAGSVPAGISLASNIAGDIQSWELRSAESSVGRTWRAVDSKGVITDGIENVTVNESDPTQWTRQVQITVKTADDQLLSQVFNEYISGINGEVLISSSEGTGGMMRTTTHQHYGYQGAGASEFPEGVPEYVAGRLRYTIYPDGSWVKRDFDESGRETGTYRPWKDGPAHPDLATSSNCRYTSLVGSESKSEFVMGVLISESYSFSGSAAEVVIPGGENEIFLAEGKVLSTPTTGPRITTSYAEQQSGAYLSAYSDGGATFSSEIEEGNWVDGVFTAGEGNATLSWRANVYRDTTASDTRYVMIPLHTLRTVDLKIDGNRIRSEEQVLVSATEWETVSVSHYEYDADGRQVSMTKDGDIISSIERHSSLSQTEVNSVGLATFISYSVDGNSQTREENGITTTTTTNTVGLTQEISKTVMAGGVSRNTLASITKDIFGRTASSTDASGRTTNFSYPNELTTVETAPGGVVTTTIMYLDGQTKSIVTTGGSSQYFDYTVSPEGEVTTKISSSPSSLARWSASTVNALGEMTSESRSGPNASTITTTHTYDAQGRLVSSSTPDLASSLIEYNIYDEPYRQGRDTNGNGLLDETSADPLTESLASYVKIGGSWWRETVNRTWLKNDDATVVDTITQRTRLNAGAGSETQTIDRFNNITTTVTSVDRANATVTRTTTSNLSNLTATETLISGRLVSSTTLTDSNSATYTYDDFGRVETVTDPRTGTTTYTYNDFDQPLTVTDGLGKTTTYTYYPAAQYPEGQPVVPAHVNAGQLKSTTDPTQKTIYQAYDAFGRLTHTWGATYPVRYEYNADGQRTVMHTYRDFGVTTEQLPAAFSTSGDTTVWTYDEASGLLEEKADATNQKTLYTYTNAGLPLTRTWARNITTTYGHDAFGKVTTTTYSDDTPDTARTYDRAGRPLTISGGPGGTRTFDHTGPTTETYSGGVLDEAVITDSRDAFGRFTGQSLTLGGQPVATTAYTYSLSNRLDGAALAANGQTISTGYGYHPTRGYLQITATGLVGQSAITTTRNLDAAGRIDSIQTTGPGSAIISGRTYQRDDAGKITYATLPDNDYWSYDYDDKNQVTSGTRHQSGGAILNGLASGYQYDDIGNRQTTTLNSPGSPATLATTYTPNSLNQYSSVANPSAKVIVGEAIPAASLTINNTAATRQGKWFAGPVTGDNSSAPAWLPVSVKATQTGGGINGSDLTKTTTGNLYLPPATETLSYDLDGNLQSDGRWSYTWDAENRLIAMQTHPSAIAAGIPIKRVEYQYDADSRRIARTEPVWDSGNATFQPDPSPTHYIWKNWSLLAEFTLEASVPKITKTYLWGLDLAESLDQTGNVGNLLAIFDQTGPTPITLLPGYDSNGNIISLADAATATKAITYEYDAFGQKVIKTNHAALENKPATLIEALEKNQWSFSTKPEDPTTGLHYYGYRFYDSTTGRWINRDPIEEEGGVNLYGFVGNNGINESDYLGLFLDYYRHWLWASGTDLTESFSTFDKNWEVDDFPDYAKAKSEICEKQSTISINTVIQVDFGATSIGVGDVRLIGTIVYDSISRLWWLSGGHISIDDNFYDFNKARRKLSSEILTRVGGAPAGKDFWVRIFGKRDVSDGSCCSEMY